MNKFVWMLDRERDEEFRRHLYEAHGFATMLRMDEMLLVIARRYRTECETCERYAETLEVAE